MGSDTMKTYIFGATLVGLIAVAACSRAAAAGPNGGDVVSIKAAPPMRSSCPTASLER